MTIEYPEINSKLPGDTPRETDPYKCWFEFMQHSDSATWCDEVVRDFGEINIDTNFNTWWPDHKHIFRKFVPVVIEEIVTQQDLRTCDDNGWFDDPDIAVIAIHMYRPQKEINEALKKWLEKKRPNKRGTSKFNDEFACEYELIRKPITPMLRNALRTYVAVEKNKLEQNQRPFHEIEDELKLINKTKWGKRRTPRDKDTQTQTISRYYRTAKEVMEGVVIGRFPVYAEDVA